MHILIIPSHLYLPANNHLSGIFQRNQAEALRNHGVSVGILSPGIISLQDLFKKIEYPYVSEENGIYVMRKWERSFFLNRSIFGDVRAKKYLKIGIKLYQEYVSKFGKPDIIHAHNAINSGYLASSIKYIYKVPYIVTEHNSSYERNLYGTFELNRTKKAYESADKLIAVSSALRNTIHQTFGSNFDCVVIPNSIDKIFYNSFQDDKKSINDEFIFLNVGSLDRNKNQKDLIIAFSKFSNQQNVRLKIAGSGSSKTELLKIVEDLKLTHSVEFLGTLTSEQVKNEMQKAHVFVLSSIVETFGLVLAEALACGCIVVSTKCGGPEDIITEKNGILVPVKDTDSLFEAMVKVRENFDNYDLTEISRLSKNNYSNEMVAKRLTDLYEEIKN